MPEAIAAVDEISRRGLAELHTHLGGSVDPAVMWTLAHEQGIALPVKDYWDFDRLICVDPRGVDGLPQLDAIYRWTELIQSSPLAVERSVHGAIGGAYRKQNITTLELRFNPMKRNRGGERDLDHIIMAAIRGLDLASIEYPQVRAGPASASRSMSARRAVRTGSRRSARSSSICARSGSATASSPRRTRRRCA